MTHRLGLDTSRKILGKSLQVNHRREPNTLPLIRLDHFFKDRAQWRVLPDDSAFHAMTARKLNDGEVDSEATQMGFENVADERPFGLALSQNIKPHHFSAALHR
jgi:hypothetical protein